jgi:hypothetical protein
MEWLIHWILGKIAEAIWRWFYAEIKLLMSSLGALEPIFSLNRRLQPNLTSHRRRVSDNIGPWPHLLP